MKSFFRSWLILTFLCLIGFILRLHFGNEKGISFDEWMTYSSSLGVIHPGVSLQFNPVTPVTSGYFYQALQQLPHQSSGSLGKILEALQRDLNLPAYFVMMSLWLRGMGHLSPLILRGPNILISVASIPLFVKIGEQFKQIKAAWLAAGLYTLTPFALFYGTDARPYTLLIFLTLLGSLLMAQYREESQLSRKKWLLLLTTVWVGMLTHYFFIFPLLFWCLIFFRRWPYQKWKAFASILLATGLPGFFDILLGTQKMAGLAQANLSKTSFSLHNLGTVIDTNFFASFFIFPPFYKGSFLPSVLFWLLMMGLLLKGIKRYFDTFTLAPLGEKGLRGAPGEGKTCTLFGFCGIWILFSLGGLILMGLMFRSWVPEVLRYWSIVVPPLYLLIGFALCQGARWQQYVQITLMSILVVFFMVCLHLSQGYPDFNYRQICTVLNQPHQPRGLILTLSGYPMGAALGYYLPSNYKIATIFSPGWQGTTQQRLAFLTQAQPTVWFSVTCNQYDAVVCYDVFHSLTRQDGFLQKGYLRTAERDPLVLALLKRRV